MKIISKLLLLIILILACSSAKETAKLKLTEEANFFWKVNSDSSTVYLLGSVHIAKQDIYPLPQIIESSFDQSDALVVEVDINNVNPMLMIQKAVYQDERTLKSELSDESYQILVDQLNQHNIPEALYSKMKPWMALTTVLLMSLQQNGFDKSLGIDSYFLQKADGKKEILQLESAEDQLNLLDSGLSGFQDEFILYSLFEQENLTDHVDSMMYLYKNGDYDELERLTLIAPKDLPGADFILEKLYKERNLKMTAKIIDFLNSNKTYFVIVGAGHLIGSDGIINLLKNNIK